MVPPQPPSGSMVTPLAVVQTPQPSGAQPSTITATMEFHQQPNSSQTQTTSEPNHLENCLMEETCGGSSTACCPINPEEPLQPQCSCEAIEVPITSSERSSFYNSCTLPLKPLKGILKKSSNNEPTPPFHHNSMTLPRGDIHLHHQHSLINPHGNQFDPHGNQFESHGNQFEPHGGQFDPHGTQFEVVPFDQVPPCDDCLQRARHRGSYGDVCHNLEVDQCGFQLQQRPFMKSPSASHQHLEMVNQTIQQPLSNNMVTTGYCCKHDRPTGSQTNLTSTNSNPNMKTNNFLVISKQNSYDEKEEVEAVESSV